MLLPFPTASGSTQRWSSCRWLVCLLGVTLTMAALEYRWVSAQDTADRRSTERWAGEMARFAEQDQRSLHHDVVFTGSSSVRMWDLEESFGDKIDGINRGFGGSIINDNIQFLNQTVVPYTPRVVVLYAGDNDIGIGMKVEEVVADYQKFCEQLHQEFPKTQLIYIAIKPSLARWEMWPRMKEVNDQIQDLAEKSDWQYFADIAPGMLGEDGKPRPELFVEDGLHMSKQGYKSWTRVMLPLIQKAMQAQSQRDETPQADEVSGN